MRRKILVSVSFIVLHVFASAALVSAQPNMPNGVLWESVGIASRDLYAGPAGSDLPDLKGSALLGRQPGGNNLKFRIREKNGDEWVAKIADESQPEVAAVRLLWGIGYKTEIDCLLPRLDLGRAGSFQNARLEARPKNINRSARWSWSQNPFIGTKELDGLKIMMALFNNWDLKDENNAILVSKDGNQFIVSDVGSSFGKLARTSDSRAGRSVNDPEGYAQSAFIKGTHDGKIDFAYVAGADHLLKGIKVESGRWLADLLLQLSDQQIHDAFRAANYKPDQISIFAKALKARIAALDAATRTTLALR